MGNEEIIMKLRMLTMIAMVIFPVHLAVAGERGAAPPVALNDEQMDRVVAGFLPSSGLVFSIDIAAELSNLPATATHPNLPSSGLTFWNQVR